MRVVRIFTIITGVFFFLRSSNENRNQTHGKLDGQTTAHVIQGSLTSHARAGVGKDLLQLFRAMLLLEEEKQQEILLHIPRNASRTISSLYRYPN